MTVLIFADGSARIGAGHQARMTTLTEALRLRGAKVVLACRDLPESTHPWIWSGEAPLVLEPALTPAAAAREAVSQISPDVLVIDHYGLDSGELSSIATSVPCAVLDDCGDRTFDGVRLVLDGTPSSIEKLRRLAVPSATGPEYALVRPVFASAAARRRSSGPALILLGGTDSTALGPRACAVLLAAGFGPVAAVVPAAAAGTFAPLKVQYGEKLTLHHGLDAPALAELMAHSRFGVLSASGVALEASCAKLPFVAFELVDNQKTMAEWLRRERVQVLKPEHIDALPSSVAMIDAKARLPIDGMGAQRAAERVLELGVSVPDLRPAAWPDWQGLLDLANDPEVRRSSFNTRPISESAHQDWLAKKLVDPDARIWVRPGETSNPEVVGTVRLQREAHAATVSIAVSPSMRGRGCGLAMLQSLSTWVERTGFCARLEAEVALDNPPSMALFDKAGYERIAPFDRDGRPSMRFSRKIRT